MSEGQFAGEIESDISGASLTERKYHRLTKKRESRNFKLGVSNGVLYGLGTYFIAKSTVIPSFFSHLTHSSAIIGLASQFENIGWYLPQLFASTLVVHRSQKMPIYRFAAWLRGLSFFALAAVTLLSPHPTLLLLLAIVLYGVFSLGSGLAGPVFLELFAKAIPSNRRGRFLGLRISLAALLTVTVGASTVSAILGQGVFPINFGWLFLIGACIASLGLFFMAVMREPRTMGLPEARTVMQQLRQGRNIYREDRRYRTYIHTRLLMASWTIGVPFLVIFAHDQLGFRVRDLGIFIAADCIGTIVGNFFWERLSDKRSTKTCLRGAAIVSLALPIIVLLYLFLPIPRIFYSVVFALAAAVDAGTTIGGMSYLVEISPETDRATYIGLFNTIMALPCFLAAGAGVILDLAGYPVLYSLVLAIAIFSVLRVNKLEHIPKLRTL